MSRSIQVIRWSILLFMGCAAAALAQPGSGSSEKLQIHGFLTQAYADAEFTEGGFTSPTQDEIVLGIPEDGTFDYRTLALQFRYQISPRDVMVIQFSSRALGDSPIGEVEDEIELDWAFYERRFGDHGYLKVGRIQTPVGIYNEIRDVGTLLPFYRPPFTFYREGSFVSETVDGAMFGYSVPAGDSATVDFDLYAGGWDLIEFLPPGLDIVAAPATEARASDVVGFHVWVNDPIPDVRFGGGIQRYSISGGFLELPGTETDWWDWHLSFDGSFEKFVVRSEYRNFRPEVNAIFPQLYEIDADVFYAQLGFLPTTNWRLYLQYEKTRDSNTSASFTESFRRTSWESYAFSLGYAFRPNLVLKLETHLIDLIEQASVVNVVPTPRGPLFEFGLRPAEDGRQTILSFSASF